MYKGAIRQGNNADIYYIPAGSTHEYLLYAFNARVDDVLSNLWIGRMGSDNPDGWTMTVVEKLETNPRTFILSTGFTHPEEGLEAFPLYITWIEGVGLSNGPVGGKRYDSYADSRALVVLCAYKNGEQVYTSATGEQYGCEYNYNPDTTHTDTIPLYSRDDSGSSTVDPVDPNQIYATLTGDKLTVHNNTGAQVTFTLNNTSVNNIAARVRANTEPVSFTESISVELSENGIYEILLTSEEWNYSVFGTINYVRSATTITKEDPASTTKKVLRGTQILIERGDKTYTLTGQEVK